jgi:hypothetical protein
MKTLLSFVTALMIISALPAQDTTIVHLSKEELKKKRKEEKAAAKEAEYQSTKAIIDSRYFILEADFLSNQRGNRRFVNSSINFIMIDSLTATVQIGSNYGIGYNGVGGITAEGNIVKWIVEFNDISKSILIKMSMISSLGIYDIFFNISSSGNTTATLSTLRYGRLIFEGKIKPAMESTIYKGSATY